MHTAAIFHALPFCLCVAFGVFLPFYDITVLLRYDFSFSFCIAQLFSFLFGSIEKNKKNGNIGWQNFHFVAFYSYFDDGKHGQSGGYECNKMILNAYKTEIINKVLVIFVCACSSTP